MGKRSKKKQDPYLEREIEKYGTPVPSREYILGLLKRAKQLLTREAIMKELDLQSDYEKEAIFRRLRAMERDGQLIRTRKGGYGLPDKMDLVRGRIISHPDGFGFVKPEDGSEDLFLPERQMRQVFHGDKVLVRVANLGYRGRKEAIIVDVLEHNTHTVVGRLIENDGITFLIPDNKRLNLDILIPNDAKGNAKPQQIVIAEIITQPSLSAVPVGRVIEVLGEHMAPGMEIEIAIRSHDLPNIWPEQVLQDIAKFSDKVDPEDKKDREDLRDKAFVTIDGDDAKDFDDAVYCEPITKGGWVLYVAIADVSHYVKPRSALDEEALRRGNSVYFPGRVIPMLPHELSNGLCSLNPRVDRLVMVCKTTISKTGKIRKYEFFPATIRSQARLTYDKVDKIIRGSDKNLLRSYKNLLPDIYELYELFKVLHHQRKVRGAIDFEIPETKIIFGKDRKIAKIVPLIRNDAHRLIEECMLVANVCAADFIASHKTPGLYRIHAGPKADSLADLKKFLSVLGLSLGGGSKPKPSDYGRLLNSVMDRPDLQLIQTTLLRSLSQAVYYPVNEGHFGLAYEAYTHFTSPIRRYPDLLVHRIIKHNLSQQSPKKFTHGKAEMQSLAEHCSLTERRADEATRDVVDWLKCEFMMDKLGKEFKGTVSGVVAFGLFVSLDEIFVEGLVHISNLRNDYYHFDPIHQQLTGDVTNNIYRLGDKINVQVARVSLEDREIDFDLLNQETLIKTRKKAKKKKE